MFSGEDGESGHRGDWTREVAQVVPLRDARATS